MKLIKGKTNTALRGNDQFAADVAAAKAFLATLKPGEKTDQDHPERRRIVAARVLVAQAKRGG